MADQSTDHEHVVRHAPGYAAYARNDQTPRHKAAAVWQHKYQWYCHCGHQR